MFNPSPYPAGAEYDPHCPWNASEDEEEDGLMECPDCGLEESDCECYSEEDLDDELYDSGL